MKKAIVVVSFGTSYIDSLEKSIKRVESQIAEYFQKPAGQRPTF